MSLTSFFLSNFTEKWECLQINSRLASSVTEERFFRCFFSFFSFLVGEGMMEDEGRLKTFDLARSKSAYFTHISNQPPKTVSGFERVEQEAI